MVSFHKDVPEVSITFHILDTTLVPNSSQAIDKHGESGWEVGAPKRREWRGSRLAPQRGVYTMNHPTRFAMMTLTSLRGKV